MKKFRISPVVLATACATMLLAGGCNKKTDSTANPAPQTQPAADQSAQSTPAPPAAAPASSAAATTPAPAPQQEAAAPAATPAPAAATNPAPAPPPAPLVIPAGTHIRVSLGETLGSKISQPGQTFTATVADPIVVDGRTVVRAGAPASGTVIDAKSLGRFKGQAELAIRLDTIRAKGGTYQIATSTVERVEKGKGKRTAGFVGGGAGLGAIIGGIAGGGKGALVGGLLGAGAGTAGTAFTGNKEIEIPAETLLTFRLEQSVPLRR